MKKFVLISLIVALTLFLTGPSHATSVLGKFCFQLDQHSDFWIWQVEELRPGYLQVTGYDIYNGPGAMDGGGFIEGEILRLTVQEASPDANIHGTHAIYIDLSTLSGTTDLVWEDATGTPFATFQDLTFQNVPCPQGGASIESDLPSTSGK